MGIPLVRGRNFTEHDTKDSALVAIINEETAKQAFPGEDPIGQYIENYGPKDEKLQVVGVVGNVRHLALETAPRPELYQPLGQGMWPLVQHRRPDLAGKSADACCRRCSRPSGT